LTDRVPATVTALLRHPVKSARAERLDTVDVGVAGLDRDRGWGCVDQEDGTVGSLKHPGRWGALLGVGARVDGDDVVVGVAGRRAVAGTPAADALLSEQVGRPVRLTQDVPEAARLHRLLPDDAGMVPPWIEGVAGQELLTDVAGARPGGRFMDFGAVHLVTTGALARLAGELGRDSVDIAPFRPNLVLDAPADPEPGQRLRLGDVLLRVVLRTPRCVVPGLAVDGVDRPLLGALARHHRAQVADLGTAACFGVYAEVLAPGRLAVGQPVEGT
jgi:uncharacterized protein YcbX